MKILWQLWIAGTLLAASRGGDEALAPDGRRGLGAELSLTDFNSLVRSEDADDVEFLSGLYALEGEIRVQVALARDEYRERGYFALLKRGSEEDLDALHAAYQKARENPVKALDKGSASGRAFARMLCDPRFNTRIELLRNFEFEAREVRAGLAVLRGTADGWVNLTPEETRAILTRIDLAASLLRALRSDLLALRTTSGTISEEPPDELRELLEAEKLRTEAERRTAVSDVMVRCDQHVESMRQALFQTRLLPKVRTLLTWREGDLRQAEPLRAQALLHLPDTPEGRAAKGAIEKLARHERMRYAITYGQECLVFDPLDEVGAWASAEGIDFLWGNRESRPYYDRFLALRGIRSYDERSYRGRELDAREERALYVVQLPWAPPMR